MGKKLHFVSSSFRFPLAEFYLIRSALVAVEFHAVSLYSVLAVYVHVSSFGSVERALARLNFHTPHHIDLGYYRREKSHCQKALV